MMHIMLTANAAWNILNFRKPLVQGLLSDGHHLTVLAPPDHSVGALEQLGCKFLPLSMDAKGLNPFSGPALARQMRAVFRQERPDVILGFTIKNNIFGSRAAGDIPFIPNVTGLGTAFLSGGILRFVAENLYRRAFARHEVVFFQNEEDRGLFLSHHLVRSDQARLLPGSGIDLEYFAPMPPAENGDAPVFLMIARLLRDKGVLEFVDAARAVHTRLPTARFQLLGELGASNRSAIHTTTLAEWQQEGVIEYLGVAPDVRPVIAAADCVVLPSYREGAPRTLIEAGAMARPVIATDVPGCRSVVAAEITGLLCPPRDAQGLEAALLRFLAMPPERRVAMGRAGRARMEDLYDQSIVVEAYRAAIAKVQMLPGAHRNTSQNREANFS
ncbi:Glycosyltransferase involved in cell wall bisynthesis [Paracoccus solventivorans]|uniref:Glycosyltransferase involved in cell wall bisynthesis n=1 Tax=Paracoccus solventivorans TaxID=53463 RepID=A0A1M7DB61_9RHOB|nr:glycosyltransferase family 4 protein [Paracoccus solventivorans]SHL76668.1 Glycosyltransferase involved in cell wall bisynthesis [Paracoccus solventivorans]